MLEPLERTARRRHSLLSEPQTAPAHHQPAFLRALNHARETPTGWIAQCPAWGCDNLLEITVDGDHYHLACETHTHQDIVSYLDLTELELRTDPITASRAWRALMLAPTIEIWQALLDGQAVPVSQLDPLWARRFGLK